MILSVYPQAIRVGENTQVLSAAVKTTIQTTKTCYGTPTVVSAEALSDSRVRVTWTPVTGKNSSISATKYTVQYALNGKWKNATTSATGTSYTISKLTGATEYEIRICASKDTKFNASAYSDSVTARTNFAVPKISSVASKVSGSAVVTWTPGSGQLASKYELAYRVVGTETWTTTEISSTAKKIVHTLPGLASGSACEFRVRALSLQPDLFADSAFSAVKKLAKVK